MQGYGDDEWRLFASTFPECRLAIGSDRFRIGARKAREFGDALSCIVLDDGLQQWRIRKDLEVVMVDGLHPFGNGFLLPLGSLREKPQDALARADIIVIHHANLLPTRGAVDALKKTLLSYTASATRSPIIATSQMKVKRLIPVRELLSGSTERSVEDGALRGKSALIVCGVGNPESVKLVVEAMGCWHTVEMESFPDHYMFTQADLQDMQRLVEHIAQQSQREVVVVLTEKDFFRAEQLMKEFAAVCDVRVLRCELEMVENAHAVRTRVREILAV